MSHLRRLPGALALITLLVLGAVPVAAQEATPQGDAATVGLQMAISRQYGVDPDAPVASPEAHAGAPFTMTARVLAYDTEEQAAAAYAALIADAVGQVESLGVNMASQVAEEEIDDLGDGAHGLTLQSTRDSISGYIRFIFVREGSTVFVVSAIAGSDEGVRISDRMAATMLDREPGEDDADFDAGGGSSGDLWELFPPEGDPVLEGLVIIRDQLISQPED